jgi:two-component system alkaline phosphatase synthesis response regulator PhoP
MTHAILVIAGDTTVREAIASTLRREGYVVLTLADVSLAEAIVQDNPLALIVLDLLPLHPHVLNFYWKLCSEPALTSIPTLVLIDHADEIAQLESSGLCATDYLLKPLRGEELRACTHTLLGQEKRGKHQPFAKQVSETVVPRHHRQRQERRAPGTELIKEEERFLMVGDLCIDLAARRMTHRNQLIELKSALLFRLLIYLVRHRGIVLSCEQLLTHVWGYDKSSIGKADTRTVYVHMHWLRELLGDTGNPPHLIHTIRGVGYRFQE